MLHNTEHYYNFFGDINRSNIINRTCVIVYIYFIKKKRLVGIDTLLYFRGMLGEINTLLKYIYLI